MLSSRPAKSEALDNRTVLITGGTGSFGKAMASKLVKGTCRQIRIFSRDEEKQDAMRRDFNEPRIKFYVGDVRDRESVDDAMEGVDLVFHAAALKQVPSCEFFPMQAVRTNVSGSENVITSAIRHGVKKVICLSTDKAVQPVNAMGMSKALMEKVAIALSRHYSESGTTVSCVRYGNVMFSRGSVIPLMLRQVKRNQAMTITNPAMTRFLLSLERAVELVEYSFQHARPGDVFIRKSPASTIGDLAKAIQSLTNQQLPFATIGVRHGEKMHETLASAEELRRSDDLGDYIRIAMDARDMNYDLYFDRGDKQTSVGQDYSSDTAEQLSVPQIADILRDSPEFNRLWNDPS